ncbi:MAG: rhomboid family intramembrane serine protease [Planctomycetia bacterium]|nr:rhomboid family intramembrane serine protease [Planctomycetia bacterium]
MVFPVGDDNSDRRTFPFVTIALIAANVFVFVVLQGMGSNEAFTMAYVQVPKEIITGQDIELEPSLRTIHTPQGDIQVTDPGLRKTPIPPWMTLFTAIFMHGSIMHLLGNMWFLWIFGDNIEDDMGHVKYLIFYLATGIIASLTFVALNSSGEAALTPCLGASGAISGVLGGYLVLHAQRRVSVILLRMMVDVPGYVAVGIWFLFQIVSGFLDQSGSGGGVAYSAHIAGFVAGMVLAKPMSMAAVRAEADPMIVLRRPTLDDQLRRRG